MLVCCRSGFKMALQCLRFQRWFTRTNLLTNRQLYTRITKLRIPQHNQNIHCRCVSMTNTPYFQTHRRNSLSLCSGAFTKVEKILTKRWSSNSASRTESLTLDSPLVVEYLDHLEDQLSKAEKVLAGEISGQDRGEAGRTISNTRAIIDLYRQHQSLVAERQELDAIISGGEDREMVRMARQEVEQLEEAVDDCEAEILELLIPEQRADHNDVVLEVTSGIGGAEAMLFAEEVFNMYTKYVDYKGWNFDIVHHDANESGGLRHASMAISGEEVYRWMKFEGGVHRVQRVPRTEKSGRMHTSTVTVSVMPQPTEIDIQIEKKDLRTDVFRASGAGGQHVNKTESAVRLTHIPSGIVVECQVDRSQIKNRQTALTVLLSRLYERELEKQQSQFQSQKKVQIGTAARSEKIRTYNFNQDRITDHRLSENRFNIEDFLTGGETLSDLQEELLEELQAESFLETLQQFRKSQKQKQ